ncbi:putative glutathione transferase [Helianthus annuus]|nr:putative glutathione transferase [Helianthus annuus]KAJ0596827.1 putative glutathione transferase [Helianthus annuus]KAJ0757505.1 putative glutathione transferase [Helianthus annuus]
MMTNGEKKLQLYSCFISHPSFSVRIALNLKGLDYECKSINVFKGEQSRPEFLKISPMGFVPTLLDGDMVLAESSAIILYLDDKYPQHPLLPHDLKKRAINYQAANIISSTIQPTLRIPILAYIRDNIGPDERITWVHKHIGKGFAALEILVKDHAGKYATGDDICLVDVLLAPQIIGTLERYNFDISNYPLLSRLSESYKQVPAIRNALPENQPDFPKELKGIILIRIY